MYRILYSLTNLHIYGQKKKNLAATYVLQRAVSSLKIQFKENLRRRTYLTWLTQALNDFSLWSP
jgi:hypothetical protein